MTRYPALFSRLRKSGRAAFVPFAVLGYPSPQTSLKWIRPLLEFADALELGLPFSDPIADGPLIQMASQAALAAGACRASNLAIVTAIRTEYPDLPIGLLVYANLIYRMGVDAFYATVREAGVDSVLVADVPVTEIEPFATQACAQGIDPILIAPPNAPDPTLEQIARKTRGYTYVVSRSGITGTETVAGRPSIELLTRLRDLGAPPALVGFGISNPRDIRRMLEAGADGVIVGSSLIEKARLPHDLRPYLQELRQATQR
ncbi:MAG: tryptophan synthase subunit alpha [Gammaproteobacteria bacterium]